MMLLVFNLMTGLMLICLKSFPVKLICEDYNVSLG